MNINNIELQQREQKVTITVEDDDVDSVTRDFQNKDLKKSKSSLNQDMGKHSPINRDETLMFTSPDVEVDFGNNSTNNMFRNFRH